jgi:hypothetical protein
MAPAASRIDRMTATGRSSIKAHRRRRFHNSALCILIFALLAVVGCRSMFGTTSPGEQAPLWNGTDFTGWHRYVADPTVEVNNVWRVLNHVIRCSGEADGYMRTVNRYRNYRLHVEWRWPEQAGNSGVLLHLSGPDQLWPTCIECQLKAGNAGDFVLMNGAGLTVNGVNRREPGKQFVAIEKKAPVSEKSIGQWNVCEIHCRKGRIRCFVNGVLQNEGTKADPSSGWIGLQSEGDPIEFRNIYLLPAR